MNQKKELQLAMDAIPSDAVRHWLRGERFDFGLKQWTAPNEQFSEPKPVEYEFEHASGFGGVNLCERYRCPACGLAAEINDMIQIRWVNDGDGNLQLQQRTRLPTVDASGAFSGFTDWSDWSAVPIVHADDAMRLTVDVFDTRE